MAQTVLKRDLFVSWQIVHILKNAIEHLIRGVVSPTHIRWRRVGVVGIGSRVVVGTLHIKCTARGNLGHIKRLIHSLPIEIPIWNTNHFGGISRRFHEIQLPTFSNEVGVGQEADQTEICGYVDGPFDRGHLIGWKEKVEVRILIVFDFPNDRLIGKKYVDVRAVLFGKWVGCVVQLHQKIAPRRKDLASTRRKSVGHEAGCPSPIKMLRRNSEFTK
ncbi:MAG: Uncharacterised protein [Flavobacteriia bacterium]|nr:MAG: Uncharacterised protein [Flavobacteriia bacterium]